jgi:hypothetical protein
MTPMKKQATINRWRSRRMNFCQAQRKLSHNAQNAKTRVTSVAQPLSFDPDDPAHNQEEHAQPARPQSGVLIHRFPAIRDHVYLDSHVFASSPNVAMDRREL